MADWDALRQTLEDLAAGDRRVLDVETVISVLINDKVNTLLGELTSLADDIEADRVTADCETHSPTRYVCAEAIRQYVQLYRKATGG